jgi:uncharacterized protein (TIGR02246 family)
MAVWAEVFRIRHEPWERKCVLSETDATGHGGDGPIKGEVPRCRDGQFQARNADNPAPRRGGTILRESSPGGTATRQLESPIYRITTNKGIAMKTLVTILAMLVVAGCMQAPQTDVEGLKAMRDEWQSAFETGDTNAMADLYTADGAVLPPNADPVSGRPAIAAFWKDFSESGLSGVVEDDDAYAQGDLGYKQGQYTMTDADGNIVDQGKYIEIWRQVEGEWQLHRDIFNSNRPAAAASTPTNRVVVTAQVADVGKWEKGFRTHGELFTSMSLSKSHYAMNEETNRIAVYTEPANFEQFMSVLESQATAGAMEFDGIDRETVNVFVLDKVFEY